MNPLTLVKRIQNINAREAQLGISEDASWHAKYKGSAYVYAGGIPFELTEGDLLAIFAQYGEVVDVNLVRDKGTGKSKGFAFVAYEDQRSTNLAVDNLNGAQVVGRTIRVDHVDKYKKKEEEDEEEEQRKREERGVCRAFQRGECTRGAGCKFSHNEQRAANTGWGAEDKKWGHDNYDGPKRNEEEDDGEKQRRREERGVCRAFQRGECNRGAGCKFSHNERRAANTGWGAEDRKREHDSYDGLRKSDKRPGTFPSDRVTEPRMQEDKFKTVPDRRALGEEKRTSRRRGEDDELGPRSREDYDRREEKKPRRDDCSEYQSKAYHDRRDNRRPRRQGNDELELRPKSGEDKRLRRRGDDAAYEPRPREDHVKSEYNRREDRRSCRPDDDLEASDIKEGRDRMEENRHRRPSHDESELKSRASRDRREGERLRRPNDDLEASDMKEDCDRMEEKRSRRPSHEESEPRSRASQDRREGERLRRHHDDEVPPKSGEDLQKGD